MKLLQMNGCPCFHHMLMTISLRVTRALLHVIHDVSSWFVSSARDDCIGTTMGHDFKMVWVVEVKGNYGDI